MYEAVACAPGSRSNCTKGVEHCSKQEGDEIEAGIERSGRSFSPEYWFGAEAVSERFDQGETGDTYSQDGTSQNIGRIVDTQIDSRSTNDEYIAKGYASQPAREEKNRHSQTEEEYGVIAGERTPSDEIVRAFTVGDAELKEGIPQRTFAVRKSEGQNSCDKYCCSTKEDAGDND